MHTLNVLILGPSSFISTLNELKPFLKFNPLVEKSGNNHSLILFHEKALKDKQQKEFIESSNITKVCVGRKKDGHKNSDNFLEIPATLKDFNTIVENTAAKKTYTINSSIEVKSYILNKNEKKLSKSNNYILLTEKEIQLLELFLKNKKPISKDIILSSVWNYSSDADTHTVETHIYRLRKKITEKFMDERFILNNKDGYYL